MYNNLRLAYIITSSNEEARKIGLSLVEHKLAACINILPGMESIYKWENQIVQETECVLIAKTHYSKMKMLTQKVKELHSNTCPCIVSITLTENEGNRDYLNWLIQESKGELSV